MADAVVIGAGPNGLVAANVLADAGWEVLVLEAQPEPGGAVRSGPLTLPGFTHDRFSAFYPLGAASPHLARLRLEEHGLRWRAAPVALADPLEDGTAAILSRDLGETCASVDLAARGDGAAWRELMTWWDGIGPRLLAALLDPFPPVRRGARLALALGGPRALLGFARFGLLPVRRFAAERFRGDAAARLLAGNALHTDIGPDTPGGALYGMVLAGLGQQIGWPVPEGGAGRLTDALVARLRSRGGRVECGARVERILVRHGRAAGVRTGDGREAAARRAVLASTGAPQLYLELLEREHVPARVLAAIRRFEYDTGTVKVDWALDGPIPWAAPEVARAGTVHVTGGLDDLAAQAASSRAGSSPRGRSSCWPVRALRPGAPAGGQGDGLGLHARPAAGRRGRRAGRPRRPLGPRRARDDRGPHRGAAGGGRARLLRAGAEAPRRRAARAPGGGREPRRRRPERRHRPAAPAARAAPRAGAGPDGDAGPRSLPGLRLRPPGRGRARRAGRQRRPGGAGARAHQALMAQPKVTFWGFSGSIFTEYEEPGAYGPRSWPAMM